MATVKRAKSQGITLIKKANDLIEARYKFDVWETRFFLSVVAQIRREDTEFQTYRVWYKDIAKTFGLRNHNAYDLLRQAANSLMSKVFKINYEDAGFTRQKTYHIIRKTDVLAEGQEHREGASKQEYIDVTVEHEMKPYLLQLQRNFTAYELRNVVKLGVYPIRIYELLKQYESIGERVLRVENLKKMFELENEYPRFPNFNQRIIVPAVRDINLYTDLQITDVEQLKEGRAVAALRFKFVGKTDAQLREQRGEVKSAPKNALPTGEILEASPGENESTQAERDRLFKLFYEPVVQKFGVSPTAFLDLLDKHSEEQIHQALRVTRRAKANDQIKSSVPGFFIHALRNGYTDPQEEQLKQQARAEKRQIMLDQMEALKEEYQSKINEKIRELIADDEGVRTAAIQKVSRDLAEFIELKYAGEPPSTEVFRQDPTLRAAIIQAIRDARRLDFLPIENEFVPRIEALRLSVDSQWQTNG